MSEDGRRVVKGRGRGRGRVQAAAVTEEVDDKSSSESSSTAGGAGSGADTGGSAKKVRLLCLISLIRSCIVYNRSLFMLMNHS